MDIFKLLSRATKQTRKPSATGSQTKLPSAGSNPNPQLYHDPVSESRGQKRKHDEGRAEQNKDSLSDEEVDFFAPKAEKKGSAKRQAVLRDGTQGAREGVPEGLQRESRLLNEGECRQVLRSHRLKVTLLPSKGIQGASVKKSKKTSKKRKTNEANNVEVKEELKQLYPQPLTAFADLQSTYGISKRLGENLASQGYKIPTEVQMGSLPLLIKPDIALGTTADGSEMLKGDAPINLLTVAPTGSGKTLAFLIPAVNSMVQRRRENKAEGGHLLEAIVVAPTKELASQIVNEAKKLAIGTGIKIVEMRKGMNVVEVPEKPDGSASDSSSNYDEEDESEEEEEEEEEVDGAKAEPKSKQRSVQPKVKADILVTTPLVLLHALSSGSSEEKSLLPTVRHLILDEADVLLDPLFREQTLGIWDACTHHDLAVTLWSATMGSNIETLASDTIQARAERLKLINRPRTIRLVVGLKDTAIPNITHKLIYTANEPGKLLALRQLLHPTSSTTNTSTTPLRPPFLIFTQTIPRATALHSELLYDIPLTAGGPSRIAVLHSSLSSPARSAIMSRFRSGEIWILITTDLLSRGVDFRGINGVVNYDIPNSAASYVHRVGRTGRAGREGGVAVTFWGKEDVPFMKNIANVIAASEKAAGKMGGEGVVDGGEGIQKWFLDALPRVGKKEKEELKLHGVEARRTVVRKSMVGMGKGKGEGKGKGMGKGGSKISTKSGFERREENRKRGAIEGSKRRMLQGENVVHGDTGAVAGEAGEWSGFDD